MPNIKLEGPYTTSTPLTLKQKAKNVIGVVFCAALVGAICFIPFTLIYLAVQLAQKLLGE